jgi:hypothetical protein
MTASALPDIGLAKAKPMAITRYKMQSHEGSVERGSEKKRSTSSKNRWWLNTCIKPCVLMKNASTSIVVVVRSGSTRICGTPGGSRDWHSTIGAPRGSVVNGDGPATFSTIFRTL